MKKLNVTLTVILSLTWSLTSFAGQSSIPLESGLRPASDDLIYKGASLNSRDADELRKNQKIDLSLLDPKNNDIWSNTQIELNKTFNDQKEIALENSEVVNFEGAILSSSGLFRFNVIPQNGNRIFAVHLDKTLHSILLRKNILRKLGYKIPAMKYLSQLTVQFQSKYQMEEFLKKQIPEATLGAPERWTEKVNETKLQVTLKDLAVTEPSETDFYNVSLGVPTQAINSRTLKALVLPYALADLPESINMFSWVAGKVDNKSVILSHFTSNEFNSSVEDVKWILRKINTWTRSDFQEIANQSYLPKELASLLTEKLISRRNSLNRLFKIEVSDLAFNSKITIGDKVKNGKVSDVEFPSYASRFAYGDAKNPLDEIRFFIYSKIQSNIIDNLVGRFNEKLIGYDLSEARFKFFEKQFKDGLEDFVRTGELKPIGVGTWTSPVLNARLLFARDIIVGNYLGTGNPVQLADTFGASIDIGGFVGIEGFGTDMEAGIKASTQFVRTYSHIKPVKSLKQSLKEPYRNMFVPLLKRSLREKFFTLSEIKNSTSVEAERAKEIQALLEEISSQLKIGESLIVTDRIMPEVSGNLGFSVGMIEGSVGARGSVTVLNRLHLVKRKADTLQIYDDFGFSKKIKVSFEIEKFIPILEIEAEKDNGKYKVKSYQVDLSAGENLQMNARGVYEVLKNNNFEILDTVNPPVEIRAKYKDTEKEVALLFLRLEKQNEKTYYDVKAKDGVEGSYFSLEKESYFGFNYEMFAKQLVNYYIAEKYEGVEITEDMRAKPADTTFGMSFNQSVEFQASLDENKRFDQKILVISDVQMGWVIGQKRLIRFMKKINEKFKTKLFEPDEIDFKRLSLYEAGYHVNIYNRGLERLKKIQLSEIENLERIYTFKAACNPMQPQFQTPVCGDLRQLKAKLKKCLKATTDEKLAECQVDYAQALLNDLEFSDFKKLIGENNFYLHAEIDGFRTGSEVLNDTIYANTIGVIGSQDWEGPIEEVRDLLGVSSGEFGGKWLRSSR